MHRSLSWVVSAAMLTLFTGCGADRVATPEPQLQGEYALETVNGITLPFLKGTSASGRVEVVSGSLTLRSNGTYSGQIVEQWTSGAGIELFPETSSGAYKVSGKQLTFTDAANGAVHHGTLNGSRINATLIDVTFGFVAK